MDHEASPVDVMHEAVTRNSVDSGEVTSTKDQLTILSSAEGAESVAVSGLAVTTLTSSLIGPLMSADVPQRDGSRKVTNTTNTTDKVSYVCPFGVDRHDTGTTYVAGSRVALRLHMMMVHGRDVLRDHDIVKDNIVALSRDALRRKLDYYLTKLKSGYMNKKYGAFLVSRGCGGELVPEAAAILQRVLSDMAAESSAVQSTSGFSGSVNSGSSVAVATVAQTSVAAEFVNRSAIIRQLSAAERMAAGIATRMKFMCLNCEFATNKMRVIRRHCISVHEAEWQRNGLPLRGITREDLQQQASAESADIEETVCQTLATTADSIRSDEVMLSGTDSPVSVTSAMEQFL